MNVYSDEGIPCDCNECKNFYKQTRMAYPDVYEYLTL